MLPSVNPTQTNSWKKLESHRQEFSQKNLRQLFESDPQRFAKFSLEFEEVLFDFSKNLIDKKTLRLLEKLFEECGVAESIEKMFGGAKINETENRAVLHTALRNFSDSQVITDGKDVMPDVKKVLSQMDSFSKKIISGEWKGHSGKAISDIVNIGIGGSDLGPQMVYEALHPYREKHLQCHFVSNVDGAHIAQTLEKVNPETTLFIIASKSFGTQETMANAHAARDWFLENGGLQDSVKQHFVAVSTNEESVIEFGIDPQNMFEFWDWVGGRYSVWSAIGLSLCCGLGYENFEKFLLGAHQMDEHFRTEDFMKNIPMQMAAIGIWYVNFWDAESEVIVPYSQNLQRFAAYFQQGNMESNGKSMDRNGERVSYQTGPVIWGEPGTNGQHAFFQLLHQGTRFIPADFIGFANPNTNLRSHHNKLIANFLAQTEALMTGRSFEEAQAATKLDSEKEIAFRTFAGNKPTTTILGKKLTPKTLGILMAAYEHKIFVQGVVWNIFSFDQWGVQLGKILAKNLLPKIENGEGLEAHDSSTAGLIGYLRS